MWEINMSAVKFNSLLISSETRVNTAVDSYEKAVSMYVPFTLFPFMTTLVAMILGLSALRFVFIDKIYTKIIDKYDGEISELNGIDVKETDEVEYRRELFWYYQNVGKYRQLQRQNIAMVALDILSLFIIIILVYITTYHLEIHQDLLVVILLFFVSAPLLSIGKHIFEIQKTEAKLKLYILFRFAQVRILWVFGINQTDQIVIRQVLQISYPVIDISQFFKRGIQFAPF